MTLISCVGYNNFIRVRLTERYYLMQSTIQLNIFFTIYCVINFNTNQ